MSYSEWPLLVGQTEQKEWSGRKYQFLVGSNHQDQMQVIDAIDTNTPLGYFLEEAVDDIVLRTLCFLSYYQINPTFDNNDGVGTDFFWFPLDYLNDDRYEHLTSRIGEDDEEEDEVEEEDDEDEDAMLPDFPVMSTVGEPIIEAATEDVYFTQAERKSKEARQEVLQERIKTKQREVIEEVEEWLEEGMSSSPYPDDLSRFSYYVGTLPAYILLKLIKEEGDRIDNIYEIFDNIGVEEEEDFEQGPQFLLEKLNTLAENYPVFLMPAIEAFCLDTNNRDCDYHVTKTSGLKVENLTKCEYCGSDLFRIFRTGLDSTVQDAWMQGLLPELITARLLQEANWTDQVLPHRLVQMEKDGEQTPTVEVDVIVHTKQDKTIFVEVTSQTDALSRVVDKKNKFEEAGIEYDGLVQIAPYDNQNIVSFADDVVSVPGWMIRGLETEGFRQDLFDEVEAL